MTKTVKLFVGGIPPKVNKQELESIFKEFAPHVKIDLRRRPSSSLNKGYAFLLVDDPVIANRIVETEFEIRQRKLQVQHSKKVPKSQSVAPLRLYCKGIPAEVTDKELTNFFSRFVECRAAYSIKNNYGRQKGYGFIEVFTKESSLTLLAIKTFNLNDSHLVVEEFSRLIRSKPLNDMQVAMSLDYSSEFQINESQNISFTNLDIKPEFIEQKQDTIKTSTHLKFNTSKGFVSRTEVWKHPIEINKPKIKDHPSNIICQTKPDYIGDKNYSNMMPVNLRLSLIHRISNPISKYSLVKIGDLTWINRNPQADLEKNKSLLHHEVTNVRFNILKKLTPD